MVHAQWNNTCAKHILCVDSYENRVLKGRLYKSGQEMEEISSLGDFLVTMESIVDGESHPAGIEKLPVLRKGKLWIKVLGTVVGCILYRFIIALALRLDLPSECLKLVSAIIVAVAIALPTIRKNKGGK